MSQIAKEIYLASTNGKYNQWDYMSQDAKQPFLNSANRVEQMILEARIEALESVCMDSIEEILFADDVTVDERIADLKAELEKLNKEKQWLKIGQSNNSQFQ